MGCLVWGWGWGWTNAIGEQSRAQDWPFGSTANTDANILPAFACFHRPLASMGRNARLVENRHSPRTSLANTSALELMAFAAV